MYPQLIVKKIQRDDKPSIIQKLFFISNKKLPFEYSRHRTKVQVIALPQENKCTDEIAKGEDVDTVRAGEKNYS